MEPSNLTHLMSQYNLYNYNDMIGSGAAASIFLIDEKKTRTRRAMKVCSLKNARREVACYNALRGCQGFLRLRGWCKKKKEAVLILDLIRMDLEELYLGFAALLTPREVAGLAMQMIGCLQTLHCKGFVHCDIKPSNFGVVPNIRNRSVDVYLFDFDLCVKDRGGDKLVQAPEGFQGNMTFASANALLGYEQGRRDDLESLVYTIIYLAQGPLPWHSEGRDDLLGDLTACAASRAELSVEGLRGVLPPVFADFLQYVRNVEPAVDLDYDRFKEAFARLHETSEDL